MDLNQAIHLLKNAGPFSNSTHWADLGSGDGLFTQALAALLAVGSTLYAVDSEKNVLEKIPENENVRIITHHFDFIKEPWPIDDLDGILMANSFHYVNDKIQFLERSFKYLKKSHQFIIIEYDTDRSNPWIPYPIDFSGLNSIFKELGYEHIEKIGEVPSVFGDRTIYSARIY